MENKSGTDDDEEGGGGPSIPELLAFVRGAPKRRRRAARIAFGVTVVLGVSVAILKPPVYVTEVKILAQRSGTLKDVATRSSRDESPTKGASETILKRDNMLGIIQEVGLVDRWEIDRPRILRVTDAIRQRLRGKPTEEDTIRAIVGILEKSISVSSDDLTVTITVQWGNAQTAYDIVSAAEHRFIDARRSGEVGMIGDAIDILEAHLKTEREKLDQAVTELQQLETAKRTGTPVPADSSAPAAGSAGSPSSPSSPPERQIMLHPRKMGAVASPERKLLDEKRQRITELEAEQQRQINDLNTQLTTLRGTLTPAHPSIVALERRLEIAKYPSEEVATLRQQIQQLEAEIAEATPTPYAGGPQASTHGDRDAGASPILLLERPEDDAETSLAKQKLTNATLKYDELQTRLRAAKIELDVADAAFKYKYSILTPAEVPRDPKKPSATLIGIVGVVAAFLFYFLIPTALDLFAGVFIASWQAKKLGIPLLGEVDPPV